MKKQLLLLGASAMLLTSVSAQAAFAQSDTKKAKKDDDQIVVTGTRREARSATDTPAPVDVISGSEFVNQGGSDLSNLLRTAVPSYNVNAQPISDAATLIRPANLRGLSPDETLVLVNSKRLHRAAVISFLGGGVSDGAQGPDISNIPALALKRVEVLRDGASSLYGSDAIAGVVNFITKDASEGATAEIKYGSTYEGDGDQYSVAANVGLPLGDTGFLNITGEYGNVDPTSRSVQRDDAAALIAAGNTAVADPAQVWGTPQIDDSIKTFFNAGVKFGETGELYAFGNYAQRRVEGGFFFRNPTNRGGVYAGPLVDPNTGLADPNGVPSVRVGDMSNAGNCTIAGIPLTSGGGLIPDPTILAAVNANPDCFSFVQLFPGGFTPKFGGNLDDRSVVVGVKGEIDLGTGLNYDISYDYGVNNAQFFINNTVNASLGANTPTSFTPGGYSQEENTINADFSYGIPVEGFASDLNLAGGFEYRSESFTIHAGDPASYEIGPLAASSATYPNGQGFSSSSNGFGGFTAASSGVFSQSNIAFYADAEADVTAKFTAQTAIRYEDYNSFGSNVSWKVGGLYRITPDVKFRATYSTGFHAPTAGQANVVNITTVNVGNQLIDRGTIPLSSAAGQLVADVIEAQGGTRPTLEPETSKSLSAGFVFNAGPATITIDAYNIDVDNRIALSGNNDFQQALTDYAAINAPGLVIPTGLSTSQMLNFLDANGVLNAGEFSGSEDLTQFTFFSNDFSTRTRGVDFVANMPIAYGPGETNATLTVNYNKTEVTNAGSIDAFRVLSLEGALPKWRAALTMTHDQGKFHALVRANYYGSYLDYANSTVAAPIYPSAKVLFDAQLGYDINDHFTAYVGADNLFNTYPDENAFAGGLGAKYSENSPFGFNGGFYYIRLVGRM